MVTQERFLAGTPEVLDRSPGADKGGYRIKEVTVHATGLALPSHMGVTADGRVLVSEFAAGRVRDITEGGSYIDQSKGQYAWNMEHPGGVLPLRDGRILATDSGAGKIYDISKPGPVSDVTLLFEGVSHPYGLIEFGSTLMTTFSDNIMVGVAEIVPGERFEMDKHAYVRGFPVVVTMEPYRRIHGCGGSWAGAMLSGRLLLGHAALGTIFDVTPGGSFDELRDRRYCWGLTQPLGFIADPLDDNLYVAERSTGVIKRIPREGGYARFAEPFLAGFQEPSCVRFSADGTQAYVCDRAWDTVYRVELEHLN